MASSAAAAALVSLSVACAVMALLTLYLLKNTSFFKNKPKNTRLTGGTPTFSSSSAAGKVPSVVTKAGLQAYEVTFQKGQIHPSGSNANMVFKTGLPADQCRVQFKLYFDDAWPWKETASQRVGGKLAGFLIGQGPASGGNYSSTGASCRLIFHKDYGARAYLYPQLKSAYNGSSPSWEQLDQAQSTIAKSYVATGIHVFAPNRKSVLFFKSGTWNDVEMYIKLNTPGKFDGVLELAVNGSRQRLDQVRFRYDANTKITAFAIQPFFGGSSNDYAPKTDVKAWYTTGIKLASS